MARKFFILRDIVFLYDDNEANTFYGTYYTMKKGLTTIKIHKGVLGLIDFVSY